MKRTTKKDFDKKTHKVGQKKFRSNETKANSVSSRRVVMPTQNIEGSSDVVSEALIGLRHYNEKKRLDAINSLFRFGHQNITDDYLGEVLVSTGYCLCDDDELVRGKCASYLYQMLDELDPVSLQPFYHRACVQIRAGLGHVKAPIRSDTIRFLNRIIHLNIFEEDEINQFIQTLIELDSTFITATQSSNRRNSTGGISSDIRHTLWDCIEALLSLLIEKKRMMEEGKFESSNWSITNIVNRVFRPAPSIASDVCRFITSLARNGHDDVKERIETVASELGFMMTRTGLDEQESPQPKRVIPSAQKRGGRSVFSKLSILMGGSDSD